MKMTIDETIEFFNGLECYTPEAKEATKTVIDTMRKYQKIEEIYQKWNEVNDFSYNQAMSQIGEVLKDGKDNIFLKEMTSVTPQELRKGHWIDTKENSTNTRGQIIHEVICSECNGIAYFRSMGNKYIGANICPHCGADMREVEE